MPTKTDVRRLLKKGLTGKEAARLILQDSWEVDNEREGFLSESDIQAIKGSLKTAEDIQDYNKWVDLYRLIDYSLIDAERAYLWIRGSILEVYPEVMSFYTAERVRKLSFQLPTIVTAKQYEDIKATQRQRHMEQILSLWDVIAWIDENELVPAEVLQEWEQYENTDWAEDDEYYDLLCEWLYYEKPAEFAATYISYLIQLIQEGRLKPFMLTQAEEEEIQSAWQAWHDSKKLSGYESYEALRRQIYNKGRVKLTPRITNRLIRKLGQLRDGQTSLEEGDKLLRTTYCSGQEVYEAGVAGWRVLVDEFKAGYNEPPRAYAILQEESLLGSTHIDSMGYYDQARHTQILSYLSDLSMFQQLHKEQDREEPGSGLVAHLTGQYALIRIRLKNFLAIHSVVGACSEITGILFVEKLEGWYRSIESLVSMYNFSLKRANLSGQNEYHEGPELKLPLLEIDKLKPDPEHLQYMRERMAIALGPDWFADTTLKLLEESSTLTAEELREIQEEQERRGQYSPTRGLLDKLEAADD